MKIKNTSSRLIYIAGVKLSPGDSAEIQNEWSENKYFTTLATNGEITLIDDAAEQKADKKAVKADAGDGK
ncbi:hypothetical protein OLZ31_02390 [Enterobacter asburiae]|nr:hypothetical protein [Enterobacter asburiae]